MSRLKVRTKVLIVKSRGDILDYPSLLNSEQYQIWQCSTEPVALDICQQKTPDCILLDWEFAHLQLHNQLDNQLNNQLPHQIPVVVMVETDIGELDYLVKETLTKELLISTIRNAIAQAQLKQNLELSIGINVLSQIIHSTYDLSTIFTTATTMIAKLLHMDYVEISEYIPKSQTWTNQNPDHSLQFLGDRLINLRLLQGEIVSINSIVTPDSNISCICSSQCQGSWLLAPLVVNLDLKGVICVNGQRSTKHFWQDREIDLVNNIATQLGIAIQQSLAYAQIETELTERRRIEIDLRQSEQLYATLAEATPVGIFRTDIIGNCLYVNEKWCQIAGTNPEDALGLGWINSIYEGDRQLVDTEWNKAIEAKRPFSLEYRFQNPKGEITWVYGQAVAELGITGNIVGYVGTITDISDRKLGELLLQELNESLETKVNERTQEILEQELQLRDFFDNSTDLIQSVSPEGQILFVNEAWKKALGYDDPIGLNIFQVIHPDSRAHCQSVMESLFQSLICVGVEAKYLTKDGRTIIVEGNVNCRIENGKPVSSRGIFRDISDRRQAEDRLLASKKELEQFFAMDLDLLCITDLESHFLRLNQGWEGTLGYPTAELLGKPFLEFVHPDDISKTLEAIASIKNQEKVARFVNRYRCQDGSYRSLEWHSLLFDNKIYASARDITIQKETAIVLAQAKEAAEAGTRAKTEFLASMSHEIRTPMNGVLGMAELLAGTDLNAEQQEFVQTIRDSGDALLTIINDILDLSKIESGMLELEKRLFILSDIVKSVCFLLGKVASNKKIELNCPIHPDTPTTFLGDSSRLRQILLNLVGNAIKFTKNGSVTLFISSRLVSNNSDQHELLVSVTDSGIGIKSDRIAKLFQPFTQADAATTRKYGGTGLGLAICKRLVEIMGGTIWVESLGNVGGNPPADWNLGNNFTQGSTFYFRVKLEVESSLVSENADSLLKPIYANHEAISTLKILVAEDNLVNQKVIMRILQRLGYSIDIVGNGIEVLEALTRQKYDLILMDMQMPEMDGIEATHRICDLYPSHLRPYIIAMTANAMQSDREACLAAGMNDYLSKPIRVDDLATVLKNLELATISA